MQIKMYAIVISVVRSVERERIFILPILINGILPLILIILTIPLNLGLLGLQLNDYPRIFRA